ncbi:MAG: hypothetical protein LBJ14_04170 [Desulfarculales bacterium]|nr:hypothetical protein [Desulfarculales bacterium]
MEFSTNYMKSLSKLPREWQIKIHQACKNLCNWPEVQNVKSMIDQPGYRLRVGRYRVLFKVEGNRIMVNDVRIRNERTY